MSCEAPGTAGIGGNFVLEQAVEDFLGVLAVDGDQFVADQEGELGGGDAGAIDRVDQEFAIVNIDYEVELRVKVRRQLIVVVGIVEAGDVGDHNFVKVEVVLCGNHFFQPWRDVEQVKPDGISLPFIGSVVLVLDCHDIHEV